MFRFSGTSSLTLTHKKTREVVHNCYLKIWELFFLAIFRDVNVSRLTQYLFL